MDSFTLRLGTGGGSAYVFNITAANASVQTQRWEVELPFSGLARPLDLLSPAGMP